MSELVRTYTIEGRPIPLQRPRIGKSGAYNPQSCLLEDYRLQLLAQHGYETPKLTGPQHLFVTFYMPLSKAKKKTHSGQWHSSRPDLSNLIKLIEDAAQGALFTDDCIISMLTARKKYCEGDINPRTVMYFMPLMKDGLRFLG